jgi:hypothetical protein
MDDPTSKKIKGKKEKIVKSKEDKIIDILSDKLLSGKDAPQVQLVSLDTIDPEMRELMLTAIKSMAAEQTKSHTTLNRDLGVLESIVTEYLKTFMLIGYSMEGEKVTIFHATSPQEHDSIIEHARGTLMTLLMKSQQNLQGGM